MFGTIRENTLHIAINFPSTRIVRIFYPETGDGLFLRQQEPFHLDEETHAHGRARGWRGDASLAQGEGLERTPSVQSHRNDTNAKTSYRFYIIGMFTSRSSVFMVGIPRPVDGGPATLPCHTPLVNLRLMRIHGILELMLR
ncbi:hypothetical protein BDZ89DRAFT_809683 [Hymenopellis radicata]|nr:hypothetical protein BDZ89DRAFT_809683 [Hymenopellis radicata]